MFEKYIKELIEVEDSNSINDKYNIVFKYELKDAWERIIKSVIVINDSKDNLYLYSDILKGKKYHIDINKIKPILKKYVVKLKDDELPELFINDGFINTIDFKVNDKWYNYKYYNLGYYSKEDIDSNNNLSLIFKFLIELDDELEEQVSEVGNYFVLIDDEEEEE